jgi:amidohydrolase
MTPGQLVTIRHELHRLAELSGAEAGTAAFLARQLAACRPDRLTEGLGGHGLAAVFAGRESGPTVLLRSDIDALPLPERPGHPSPSATPGVSHKCGHDGHMTMLLGLARELAETRPRRGRAVLLFQPAEETGAGARRVLDDPAFAPLRPDRVLGVHNLPGYPLGTVVLRDGPFAAASRGLTVFLEGASSHAAEPEAGRSPAQAAAQLVQALGALPQFETSLGAAAKVTVVGIDVGGPHFGTSPGAGRVMVTLRSHADQVMDRLAARCHELAAGIAAAHGLKHRLAWSEIFPATVNDPETVGRVAAAAESLGLDVARPARPFAWSEDFGHFTADHPGALVGLGAGEDLPALHHPDYDFPDDLLPFGVAFWRAALAAQLDRPVADGETHG